MLNKIWEGSRARKVNGLAILMVLLISISANVWASEDISPLFDVRMTQFAEEMGLYSEGASTDAWNLGGIETKSYNTQSDESCEGGKCPIELGIMGSGHTTNGKTCQATCSTCDCPIDTYDPTCAGTCHGNTCKDTCAATCQSTCQYSCQQTCLGLSTCETCDNTCANTCWDTCHGKTSKDTCAATCQSTCANTCGVCPI